MAVVADGLEAHTARAAAPAEADREAAVREAADRTAIARVVADQAVLTLAAAVPFA